eukprot:gene12936-biopygen10353
MAGRSIRRQPSFAHPSPVPAFDVRAPPAPAGSNDPTIRATREAAPEREAGARALQRHSLAKPPAPVGYRPRAEQERGGGARAWAEGGEPERNPFPARLGPASAVLQPRRAPPGPRMPTRREEPRLPGRRLPTPYPQSDLWGYGVGRRLPGSRGSSRRVGMRGPDTIRSRQSSRSLQPPSVRCARAHPAVAASNPPLRRTVSNAGSSATPDRQQLRIAGNAESPATPDRQRRRIASDAGSSATPDRQQRRIVSERAES